MDDVSVEVADEGARRVDGIGFEVTAETPRDLTRRPDGTGSVAIDVYRVGTECARCETDVGRKPLVAFRAVSET
jgi:hypothetical protein